MLHNFSQLFLSSAYDLIPAFLLALLISAVLAEILPESFYGKVLSSKNFISIFLASIVGALVPLCTCGMIPLANTLQKKGASWLIVISFLTAGNASSITALILTLVLGVKITFYRFLFSVIFGILVAYIFVLFFNPTNKLNINHDGRVGALHATPLHIKIISEFMSLIFSFGPWVLVSIFIAAIISMFLEPSYISKFAGRGNLFSPFLLVLGGFPFYFCAGSDIPISKVLLEKGASLGSVLAFMNAAPGVNLTSFIVYQKWLGIKNALIYLAVSFLVCGGLGVIVNSLL